MQIQDLYQETIKFVAEAHKNQKIPGSNLPYLVHLSNVCMEVISVFSSDSVLNKELAIQCSLLHDVIEDTEISYKIVKEKYGQPVADGVLALTKNREIDKKEQLLDSIERIKKQPKEIWMVKMADRITNLQEPPSNWNNKKRIAYKKEAELIYNMLKEANQKLSKRLKQKIGEYSNYIKK